MTPLATLRALVRRHGSQRKAAVALGVTEGYVSQLLSGQRDITRSPVMLAKLGYQADTRYRRIRAPQEQL